MINIDEFAKKISVWWILIGTIVTTLGLNTIGNIDVSILFSEQVFTEIVELIKGIDQAIGLTIVYIGVLKGRITTPVGDPLDPSVKSYSAKELRSIIYNPFRFAA